MVKNALDFRVLLTNESSADLLTAIAVNKRPTSLARTQPCGASDGACRLMRYLDGGPVLCGVHADHFRPAEIARPARPPFGLFLSGNSVVPRKA